MYYEYNHAVLVSRGSLNHIIWIDLNRSHDPRYLESRARHAVAPRYLPTTRFFYDLARL